MNWRGATTVDVNAFGGAYASRGGFAPRGQRGFTVYHSARWIFDDTDRPMATSSALRLVSSAMSSMALSSGSIVQTIGPRHGDSGVRKPRQKVSTHGRSSISYRSASIVCSIAAEGILNSPLKGSFNSRMRNIALAIAKDPNVRAARVVTLRRDRMPKPQNKRIDHDATTTSRGHEIGLAS